MWPKVSILMLNYNSEPFFEIVRESLESVNSLDYPDFELILVDNCSTDRSFDLLKRVCTKMRVKVKLWRASRNLGFTGGNNLAYKLADPDSEYIVLLNNDALISSNSLKEIIEYLESDEKAASAQGTITDGCETWTALYIDEVLCTRDLKQNPKRELPISYADGCYSVLKRKVLRKIGMNSKLFVDEVFAYFDDIYLGMKFWKHGYKVVGIPTEASFHYKVQTFKRMEPSWLAYIRERAHVISVCTTNSRWRKAILLQKRVRSGHPYMKKALEDGIRIAKRMERFDLYAMPYVPVGLRDLVKYLTEPFGPMKKMGLYQSRRKVEFSEIRVPDWVS